MRIERSIAAVDRVAWDRLAVNDVYARHGWLRVVEETLAAAEAPHYFLLEKDGELLAAAVCFRLDRASAPSLLEDLVFGRLSGSLARLGFSFRRVLLCGPLIGQGRHVLWRRELDHVEAATYVRRLIDELVAFTRRERLALAFTKIPADEEVLLADLRNRGFATTANWPVSYIDLEWPAFDAYVKDLSSSGMATKARREVGAPQKHGVRIARDERFDERDDALLSLIEAHEKRYSAAPLGIGAGFFRKLGEYHGDATVVTSAHAGDELLASALLLTAGDHAAGPLIGVSTDARNRKAFTYFNLALYEPIRLCIELNVRRLYLGAGLYDAKRRRGCRELPLVMLVRARSAAGRVLCRLWCALHRRWVVRKLAGESAAAGALNSQRAGIVGNRSGAGSPPASSAPSECERQSA